MQGRARRRAAGAKCTRPRVPASPGGYTHALRHSYPCKLVQLWPRNRVPRCLRAAQAGAPGASRAASAWTGRNGRLGLCGSCLGHGEPRCVLHAHRQSPAKPAARRRSPLPGACRRSGRSLSPNLWRACILAWRRSWAQARHRRWVRASCSASVWRPPAWWPLRSASPRASCCEPRHSAGMHMHALAGARVARAWVSPKARGAACMPSRVEAPVRPPRPGLFKSAQHCSCASTASAH